MIDYQKEINSYCKILKTPAIRKNYKEQISDKKVVREAKDITIKKTSEDVFDLTWDEKEESTKTLSIREYKTKKQYEIGLTEFVDKCLDEIKTRSL